MVLILLVFDVQMVAMFADPSTSRSPFPWFYFVFFMIMIIHRATRDIERCRRKYGAAWTQYEKEVPYLFFPVSPKIPQTRVHLR